MKSDGEIKSIIAAIKKFRDARDWEKFHDAKNLAICLNVEAAELLEVFLWKDPGEIDRDRLKDELADVFYSAFLLADKHGLDVGRIVRDKLKKNAAKYPDREIQGVAEEIRRALSGPLRPGLEQGQGRYPRFDGIGFRTGIHQMDRGGFQILHRGAEAFGRRRGKGVLHLV